MALIVRYFFSVIKVTAVFLLLCACSENSSVKVNDSQSGVQTIIRDGVVRSGGSIAVKIQIITDVVIDQVVAVEVVFNTSPYQDLLIEIDDNEHLNIDGSFQRFREGSEDGIIIERIELVPLTAGKQYLKMIVSHADGENPQSVAAALFVKDSDGNIPKKSKKIKGRVEYKSLPVQ